MTALNEHIVTDIDREQVLRDIGYEDTERVPTRVLTLLDDYLETVEVLISPSYCCVIKEVDLVHSPDSVLEGVVPVQSRVLSRLLKHCDRAALFCLTIGEHLEEKVSALAEEGHAVQARMLDALGSSAVESLADIVQEDVEELARANGLYSSRRFSPGYCDWQIDQQEVLFSALDGCQAGVQLGEGCLMTPRKSVSGLIGMGRSPEMVKDYNPCLTCPRLDCCGRRA